MTDSEAHYRKMTETPVSRLILNLGIPTTISMLITSIYNMADTYFVGTLGESAQAATGILFTVQAIMQGLAFMLGHGAGTHVSRALADRDADKATMYISTSFFTGIGLGLVIGVLGLAFLRPLVHFLGSTDTIAPYAMDYGFWVFLAAPTIICSLILNNGLRYEGKAFYAMIGLTAGGLLNILGDYILVMKLGMGVYGAGLATAASQLVSFVILLIMYLKMAQSTIRFRAVSRNFKIYLSICRVGLPSLTRQGLTSVTMGLLNNMTKPFGDAAIAAMSVVNRYSNFLICVGLGIGQGFQPVASFNYQARKYDRVKKGLVFTMCFGLVFIGGFSVISMICAEGIHRDFPEKRGGHCHRLHRAAIYGDRYAVFPLLRTGEYALSEHPAAHHFLCSVPHSFRCSHNSHAANWGSPAGTAGNSDRSAYGGCDSWTSQHPVHHPFPQENTRGVTKRRSVQDRSLLRFLY